MPARERSRIEGEIEFRLKHIVGVGVHVVLLVSIAISGAGMACGRRARSVPYAHTFGGLATCSAVARLARGAVDAPQLLLALRGPSYEVYALTQVADLQGYRWQQGT